MGAWPKKSMPIVAGDRFNRSIDWMQINLFDRNRVDTCLYLNVLVDLVQVIQSKVAG